MGRQSSYDDLGEAPASDDMVLLRDVSDTTMAATGTQKEVSVDNLLAASSGTYITSSAGLLSARPAASADNSRDLYFATDVDGGTLYRSNGSSWVQVAPGVNDDEVLILKGTDETRTATTTVADDSDLVFPVLANENWHAEWTLFVTSTSVTPDIKLTVNVPAGTSGHWGAQGLATGSTGNSGDMNGAANGFASTQSYAAFSGITLIRVFATALVGGTAGDVRLQWAQNTSDAAGVTLESTCVLRATKLS